MHANRSRRSSISNQIFVIRHGHVADHQGDVALTLDGRRAAFEAGRQLSRQVANKRTVSILHSPSARTSETAQELALGLAAGLPAHARMAVNIGLPRAEPAIRNFHFVVAGHLLPPTDAMDPSFPQPAARDSYLNAFWNAAEDRIGYWMSHPSDSAESPDAVAARLTNFFRSVLAAGAPDVSLLITHSGPMRAFLRAAFGADPGEPEFCEWFTVDESGVRYRGRRSEGGQGDKEGANEPR